MQLRCAGRLVLSELEKKIRQHRSPKRRERIRWSARQRLFLHVTRINQNHSSRLPTALSTSILRFPRTGHPADHESIVRVSSTQKNRTNGTRDTDTDRGNQRRNKKHTLWLSVSSSSFSHFFRSSNKERSIAFSTTRPSV